MTIAERRRQQFFRSKAEKSSKCDYPACGNGREVGELYCFQHNRKYSAEPQRISERKTMTNEDRSAIAVLAARFTESTIEIMVLADHIENAIIEELDSLAYRKRLKE